MSATSLKLLKKLAGNLIRSSRSSILAQPQLKPSTKLSRVPRGRLLSQVNGSVMVESTMALVFLFALMFGSIQLGLLSYQKASLGYAMNRGLRSGAVAPALNSRLFRRWLADEARRIGVNTDNIEIHFCPLAESADFRCVQDYQMDATTTESGEVTLVQASFTSPVIFGLGSLPVSVSAVRRFE